MKGRPISAAQRAKILEQLRKVPNVTLACLRLGIGRRSVYQVCDRDPEFKEAMDLALEEGAALLLEATWTDGLMGVEKYVVSSGRVVMDPETGALLKERVIDNSLRMSLLRAHLDKYQPKTAATTGDDVPKELQPDPSPTPDEADAPESIE